MPSFPQHESTQHLKSGGAADWVSMYPVLLTHGQGRSAHVKSYHDIDCQNLKLKHACSVWKAEGRHQFVENVAASKADTMSKQDDEPCSAKMKQELDHLQLAFDSLEERFGCLEKRLCKLEEGRKNCIADSECRFLHGPAPKVDAVPLQEQKEAHQFHKMEKQLEGLRAAALRQQQGIGCLDEKLGKAAERAENIEFLRGEKMREFSKGTWLRDNGFSGINAKKTSLGSYEYALHAAVSQKDADIVRCLLLRNADATLLNSSRKTPLQLANSLNESGSHDAVLAALRLRIHTK